jgi:crotonobetainyl-CoA:carnitine CoA-transferase CaiB-like acyl-CoA transferase
MDHVRGSTVDGDRTGPLEGVRVFDASLAVVGAWASMLLGSLGADVAHIEQPDVDWSQLSGGVPPTINGTSIGYIAWNMNKRGLSLDLKSEVDLRVAYDIIAASDVFISNMRTRAIGRLGLGYETLKEINPRLVYCVATGHGSIGPRADDRGNDPIIQGLTGFWSIQGARGSNGEAYRHYTQIDATTGNILAQAALLALYARRQTGRGQYVEVTMLDASATLQTSRLAEQFAGLVHRPRGSSAFSAAPDRAFRCHDGRWIGVSTSDDTDWRNLCTALDRPELAHDRQFVTNGLRMSNREALEGLLEVVFSQRPQEYWDWALSKAGVPWASPMRWNELRSHTQVRDNGYLVELDTDGWGRIWTAGPPWGFSRTPARVFPSPLPGIDTEAVKADCRGEARDGLLRGLSTDKESPSAPAGPLRGVVAVELAEGLAGPMTARLLGDAGADVIKVEPPSGDKSRRWSPGNGESSAVFEALNRNKRSVVVEEGDAGQLRRLLRLADVVIVDKEAVDRHAIDITALLDEHPALVVCVISPWGPDGPWSDRPGGELAAQLAAEVTSSLGRAGDEPVRMGCDHASMCASLYATQAVVAALLVADEGGQRIDVSLFGSLLHMRSTMWVALSNPDEWWGFHLENYVYPPDSGYTCKDRHVYFSVSRVTDRRALVTDLNMEFAFDDPRWPEFSNDPGGNLGQHARLVHDLWDRGLSQWTYEEAAEIVGRHGGWMYPFLTHQEFICDSQVQALGLVAESPFQGQSASRVLRTPWQLSETPATIRRPAPLLNEHRREVDEELRKIGVQVQPK